MKRMSCNLRRLALLGSALSLSLATCALGGTTSRLAFSDISQPDFFPILPWSPYHGWARPFIEDRPNGLESIAECQFNMAGFVFRKDLRLCEKLGLGAILLPVDDADTSPTYRREWRKLTEDEIERRIKQIIRAGGKSPAIKGYFIMDEPGVKDFPALGKAVAAVKGHAPGKLAYINLFPDYATLGAPDMSQLGTSNYTEYLERFVSEVRPQVISYDNYMVQFSDDLVNTEQGGQLLPQPARSPAGGVEARPSLSEYRQCEPNPAANAHSFAREFAVPSLHNTGGWVSRSDLVQLLRSGLQIHSHRSRGAEKPHLGLPAGREFPSGGPRSPYESTDLDWRVFQCACAGPGFATASRGAGRSRVLRHTGHGGGIQAQQRRMLTSMIVNLSLEKSAKFTLTTAQPCDSIKIVSAVDGSLADFDQKNGLWLTAGQGVLLVLGR